MKWFRRILPVLLLVFSIGGTALAANHPQIGKLDVLDLPEWPVTSSSFGGKLILSDSPEMVSADGIMYQDTVSGDARLFFHHVNATDKPKKIVVVLENNGNEAANVTVLQYGLGGPGHDWLAVGKDAQMKYLAGGDLYLLDVPAQGRKLLAADLADMVVEPNMLVNGIYDFKTDKPVNVKVMMLPVDQDVDKFSETATVLPADEYRLRGTFEGKDRMLVGQQVYRAKEDGWVVVTLADNKIDRYVTGIDATDGSQVVNYGNYGIVYKLFLPTSHDGKITYYLNPRGGTYAGGLGLKYRHQDVFTLATPADTLFFGENKITDIANLGTFDGGQSLWVTFSPPGASNLPVKLVLAPR